MCYLDNNVADSQETPGALEPDQSSKSLRQAIKDQRCLHIYTCTELIE